MSNTTKTIIDSAAADLVLRPLTSVTIDRSGEFSRLVASHPTWMVRVAVSSPIEYSDWASRGTYYDYQSAIDEAHSYAPTGAAARIEESTEEIELDGEELLAAARALRDDHLVEKQKSLATADALPTYLSKTDEQTIRTKIAKMYEEIAIVTERAGLACVGGWPTMPSIVSDGQRQLAEHMASLHGTLAVAFDRIAAFAASDHVCSHHAGECGIDTFMTAFTARSAHCHNCQDAARAIAHVSLFSQLPLYWQESIDPSSLTA